MGNDINVEKYWNKKRCECEMYYSRPKKAIFE